MSIINSSSSGLTFINDNSANLSIQTGGTLALTFPTSGSMAIGPTQNFGIAGQPFITNGPSSPPSWGSPPGYSLGKAIALDLVFGWYR